MKHSAPLLPLYRNPSGIITSKCRCTACERTRNMLQLIPRVASFFQNIP